MDLSALFFTDFAGRGEPGETHPAACRVLNLNHGSESAEVLTT